MINDDKVIAEKKLATKNIILVVVLGLVAVGFYAGIILVYT
ncbi:MAG: hypothetical protein ACKVIK_12650 [Rhodospirillales bacterium]|jgi:hypothetical protein|tara:strand:- start:617 stop:739 length:123 start_codon:yes stop_codon:yes gene_type:complete